MNHSPRDIREAIRFLLAATANSSLYGIEHPQVLRLVAKAYDGICNSLVSCAEISLMVIENELIINGIPQEDCRFLDRFSQILKSRGIGHIRILKGITRQEVEGLIASLSSYQGTGDETSSSEHLRVGRVEVRLGSDAETCSVNDGIASRHIELPDLSKEELERFMEIYETVRRHKKLKITGILEIVSGFVDVFRQEGKPLLVLAALRDTDEYTFTHSTNVCILNLAQAMALGIEGQLLKDIGVSAMLHDIGKLFISEEIIAKKGKLTDEEYDLMKQHPAMGARYLLETAGVPRMAPIVAFEHHAKFNLGGYPVLPADWSLNLCSHLTMISDCFDAMRTRRSYRDPIELAQINSTLLDIAGTELHPKLTQNFLQIISQLSET